VLRRIEATGAVERVRARQAAVLTTLLQDARLGRLVDQAALDTDATPAYTIDDLFTELGRGIFREAASARPVTDEFRRNLQRAFVSQMERLITTPLGTGNSARPADAQALARSTLAALQPQLRTAAANAVDRVTAAHFEDLLAKIDRILDPRG
jgi:hypothetical protein